MIFKFVQRKNKYIFRIRRHSVPSSMQKQHYFPRSSGGYIFDSIGLRKSDDAKCFWCLIHIFVQFPPSAVVRSTSISLHLLKMDPTFFSVSDISIFPSFFYKSFFFLLLFVHCYSTKAKNFTIPRMYLLLYFAISFEMFCQFIPYHHSQCPGLACHPFTAPAHTQTPHTHRVYIQCHCWRW